MNMKVRYLCHSCVEVIGRHHILIDSDFTRNLMFGVEYICITHVQKDHIRWVVEVPTGCVLAAVGVCEIAGTLGVSRERLRPMTAGERVANIDIRKDFSQVNDPAYTLFHILLRRRTPENGSNPISFKVDGEATLIHIGDAPEAGLEVFPNVLYLPWRTTPFHPQKYQDILIQMGNQFAAPFIIPIHHDMPPNDASLADHRGEASSQDLGWTGLAYIQIAPACRMG